MTTLEKLRALSEEATPGEWVCPIDEYRDRDLYDARQKNCIARYLTPENGAFVAAAVNYVRALLASPATSQGTGEEER